ncbi:MAG: SOS response-associated peptidase family protein [Salibacteraceae bacterium]
MHSIHQNLKRQDLDQLECQAAWPPSCYWNIFPGTRAYLLMQRFHHNLSFQEWGLVSDWFVKMSGYKAGLSIPFIRKEKLSLTCWAGALTHQRCIVPINGFFSTRQTEDGVRVYFSQKPDQSPFYAAGLCPFREDRPGTYGFALITNDPPLSSILNGSKVPALLHPTQVAQWLDEAVDHAEALKMLMCNHREVLESFEVSPQALQPRHQHQSLLAPIG